MDTNREMAYIVAYYLSRFNNKARINLGFSTNKKAFTDIGEKLDIPANYIKFRRDEFDVVHPHRKGWHKKTLSPRTIKTIETLQHQDEYTLRSIVLDILNTNKSPDVKTNVEKITSLIVPENENNERVFSLMRGITGRKAEEYFINWYKDNCIDFGGNKALKDVREHGCGYDFEIRENNTRVAFEIKGAASDNGGILLTQKEWETARLMKDNYILIIINGIENEDYNVQIIRNPFDLLKPRKNIQRVIQVNWGVSGKQLKEISDLE